VTGPHAPFTKPPGKLPFQARHVGAVSASGQCGGCGAAPSYALDQIEGADSAGGAVEAPPVVEEEMSWLARSIGRIAARSP
jgi:hypothetical protein